MQIWLSALLAATPSPTPSVDPSNTFYSPGTIGFLATFLVAAGAIVLIFDMVRRVRRVRYRGEVSAKLEAEALEANTLEAKSSTSAAPAAKKASAPAAKRTAKPERPAPPTRPKRD
jgi:hypothetical protein